MGSERSLKDAGIRQAYIVSWRIGNGPYHLEAFETEAGAHAFVERHKVKAKVYRGVVMNGLFPADAERAGFSDAVAEASRRRAEDGAEAKD